MKTANKTFKLNNKQRKEIEKRHKQGGDHRIVRRLSALLWLDEGRSPKEVAKLLRVQEHTVRDWVKLYIKGGLERLCFLGYQGRTCKLTPEQIEALLEEVKAGNFRSAKQAKKWIADEFHVQYSESAVKDLFRRLGVTFHKTSALIFKANRKEQEKFIEKYHSQKPKPGEPVMRFFLDAVHPVWGLQVLNYRWLIRGQELHVGAGGGRKRLNILGAWCPETHAYVDIRRWEKNVNAQTFIDVMMLLHKRFPSVKKFILYMDNARYFHAVMAKEWIKKMQKKKGVEFDLQHLPAYSPNLNLIERLWKFLKREALSTWHESFEAMQKSVARVLDHLENYADELTTLMTEKFQLFPEEAYAPFSV